MDGNTHFTFQQFFENKIQDDTKPYEKKVSEDLWIAFHMVKKKLKKELDITHSMYPHYSTHDYIHSGNIVLAIENILSREQWEKLFIADAWMFLCCAYIHDIGMTVYWDELMNDWNTKEFKEYLEYCTVSNDKSIRTASEHLLSKVIDFEKIVPPIIKREVMLLAADFYRSKHTKRIKDRSEKILSVFFSEINEVFDLPINSLEKIIEISAMHGESFEILLNSLDKADMILGMTYHPRFVASLLRLGDLCDFDNNRFSLEWIKSCGGLTEDNLVHYFKHLFVKNKYISSKEINVVVDIDCNKVDMELVNNGLAEEGILFENDGKKHDLYGRIAKESNNWFGWLENEINHIKENWNCIMPDDFPMISPEYNYKIKMDGIELLFSTSNLRFTFSQEKSYTLIENYNLYNEQLIFVREVIQNSMDALKLKFWHELKSGNFDHLIIQERLCELCDKEHNIDYSQLRPFDFIDNSIYKKYSINIFVEPDLDQENVKFTIEDNGVGISKWDFENKIVSTGQSWERKECKSDLLNIPEWLKPTGMFGIGLHSVFSMTDLIYIRTRPENGTKEYKITLHSGKKDGYVFMSESKEKAKSYCGRMGSGTYIEFYIDKNRYKENKVHSEWKNPYVKRPKGQISVSIENVIKQNVIFPLFKVLYDCGDNTGYISPLAECEQFQNLFKTEKRDNILGRTFHYPNYDFAFDVYGRTILIWNQELCTAYRLTFDRTLNRDICYRGILVKNGYSYIDNFLPHLKLDSINIMMDSTANALNVSRDNFISSWLEAFLDKSAQMSTIIAEIYYNLVVNTYQDTYVQKWINDVEESLKPSLKHNRKKELIIKDAIEMSKKYKMDSNVGFFYMYFFQGLRRSLNIQGELLKQYLQENKEEINNKEQLLYVSKERKNYMVCSSSLYEFIDLCISTVKHIIENLPSFNEPRAEFSELMIKTFEENLNMVHISEIEHVLRSVFPELYAYREDNFVGWAMERNFVNDFRISQESSDQSCPYVDIGGHDFGWAYIDRVRACVGNKDWPNLERYFIKECYFNFPVESINYFNCLPLYWIVYYMMGSGKGERLLNLKAIFSDKKFSGCNVSEDNIFAIGKNDFCDVITSSMLKIKKRHHPGVSEDLRSWEDLPLDSIELDNNSELIFSYDMHDISTRLIKVRNLLVLKKYLLMYSDDFVIPAFVGTDYIALYRKEVNSGCIVCSNKNMFIYLWNEFKKIQKYNIKNEIEKEEIINQLMRGEGEDGERLNNLISYICDFQYKRSKDGDIKYDSLKEKIQETYRLFMSDVLDCVYLSDNDLLLKIPGLN